MSHSRSERSFSETTRSPARSHLDNTKCGCGFLVSRLVSNTEKNPGRPFIKCSKDKCDLWAWEDEFNLSGPSFVSGYDKSPSPASRTEKMKGESPSNMKRKRSPSPGDHVPSKQQRTEETKNITSLDDIDLPELGSHYSDSEDDIFRPSTPIKRTSALPETNVTPKKSVSFAATRHPPTPPSTSSTQRSPNRQARNSPQKMWTSSASLQADPDNPFVSTPTRANLSFKEGSSSTLEMTNPNLLQTPGGSFVSSPDGKSESSQHLLEQIREWQDKLASKIATSDRKRIADSKSIEAKVRRIKELEEENRQSKSREDDLKRQIEALKRENQMLRDQGSIY